MFDLDALENPETHRLEAELYRKLVRRAEELAGGQAIVQDKTGLWRLENESIFP